MTSHLLRCAVELVAQSGPCLSQSNDCEACQIATFSYGISQCCMLWQTGCSPQRPQGLGQEEMGDVSEVFASGHSRISVLKWDACSRNGSYTVARHIVEGSGCSCKGARLSSAVRRPQQPLSERSSSSAAPAALVEPLLSAAALQGSSGEWPWSGLSRFHLLSRMLTLLGQLPRPFECGASRISASLHMS